MYFIYLHNNSLIIFPSSFISRIQQSFFVPFLLSTLQYTLFLKLHFNFSSFFAKIGACHVMQKGGRKEDGEILLKEMLTSCSIEN